MKTWQTVVISLAVAGLFGGAGWWLVRRPKAPPPQGAAQGMEVPKNLPHEKASLEDELKRSPGHAPIVLRLAEIDKEMGSPDQARKRLEDALKADPSLLEARLELGRMLYESGDVDGAIAQTKKILELDPKNVDALYNLGAIFANTGKVVDAGKYWHQARQYGPDTPSGKKAADGLKQIGL